MKNTGEMLQSDTGISESALHEHTGCKVSPYFWQPRRVVYPG